MGVINGRTYVFSDTEITLKGQPKECDLKLEELTQELKTAIKKSRFIQIKKDALRENIDLEVGDLYDIVADAMRLVEFNLLLTASIANTMELPANLVENLNCLSPLSDKSVTLREDFVEVKKDIADTLKRYSAVQELVKTRYADELTRLGLWG